MFCSGSPWLHWSSPVPHPFPRLGSVRLGGAGLRAVADSTNLSCLHLFGGAGTASSSSASKLRRGQDAQARGFTSWFARVLSPHQDSSPRQDSSVAPRRAYLLREREVTCRPLLDGRTTASCVLLGARLVVATPSCPGRQLAPLPLSVCRGTPCWPCLRVTRRHSAADLGALCVWCFAPGRGAPVGLCTHS